MKPIETEKSITEQVLNASDVAKKKVVKRITNYSSMIVGCFIILVVVFVFLTDINFSSTIAWVELGLTFFILIFCSYSMYINFSDSGIRAGKSSKIYIDTKEKHDKLKEQIISQNKQVYLNDFCKQYIKNEMQNVRESLLANEGLLYEDYTYKYIGKDKEALKSINGLTKPQIEAILKCNKLKPIKLTPESILKRGRGSKTRNPLGANPETKRMVDYSSKLIKSLITSILTGVIVLDVVIAPNWSTAAECFLKILPMVLNGFMGYKMGFENVTVDTVNYMNDQIDLMNEFIQYLEDKEKLEKPNA